MQPLTREQYSGGAPRPYQLFSHSDQIAQWQSRSPIASRRPDGAAAPPIGSQPHASGFPMITALSGGLFTRGQTTLAAVDRRRADAAQSGAGAERIRHGGRRGRAPARRWTFLRTHRQRQRRWSPRPSRTTQQALDIGQILNSDVTLATAFPNTTLGNQLKQVAKVIKFNSTLAGARARADRSSSVSLAASTRTRIRSTRSRTCSTQVSQAIKAFYDATVELGLERQVTTFTLSDFGRTLQPAGTGAGVVGTDHAWGNHHFVVGGAVRGGDFYGDSRPERHGLPGPAAERPERHRHPGPLDSDGVGRAVRRDARVVVRRVRGDLPLVFPNIGRFATPSSASWPDVCPFSPARLHLAIRNRSAC